MRKLTIFCILLLSTFFSGAQSIEELKSIQKEVKNPFIKTEGLDQLMISLRKYEKNPLPDQDSLMLDIYQSVSSSYVANNHFKQGLQVFNEYLAYKENMLSIEKAGAINMAMNSIGERSRNDESELLMLQNKLSELNKDNSSLSKRLVVFKSYFSLILLILSVIFAVVLAGFGIRAFSLRSRLNQNRNEMKNIHHLSVTGRYEEGVRNALQHSIASVQGEIAELKKVSIRY